MILNPQFQTKDSTGSQPTRPEYVPGVLQIKIKNDVVNEVPEGNITWTKPCTSARSTARATAACAP